MDAHDWDLHAVVRGCTAATSAVDTTAYLTPEPCTTASTEETKDDLYKPFFPATSLDCLPLTNVVIGGFQDGGLRPPPPPFAVIGSSKATAGASHKSTQRSKTRKKHMKRVSHVAAENLSSDVWCWRKYGQKPIKGSPFPRGYYKCSTSKGCTARKQVERNQSDPTMFIVTYTGEHNHPLPTHRNSLAGIPRHKPLDNDAKKLEKSDATPDGHKDNGDYTNDNGFNTTFDEDFFEGLEDFVGGECLMDNSLASSTELPRLDHGRTTTTSGC